MWTGFSEPDALPVTQPAVEETLVQQICDSFNAQWSFIVGDWLLQVFSYTKKRSLQSDDLCLDVSALGGPVKLYQCHGLGGNQLWQYSAEVSC